MGFSQPSTTGAIVFDLDGTLIDTSQDIAFAINHLRQEERLAPLTTQEVLSAVGRGAPRLVQTLFGVTDENSDVWQPLLARFNSTYLRHQGERSKPYPGIETALTTLSARYDMYVLSNKPHPATVNEIDKHGIGHFFKAIWGAGVFEALKPDPVGIEKALELSKVSSNLAVMVGDMPIDMEAGRRADVHTVHVTWGFGRLADTDPAPSGIADDAKTLTVLIDQLIKRGG